MQKSKWYYDVKFPPVAIQEAYDLFLTHVKKPQIKPHYLEVTIGPESLNFDTIEEFFADYPKATTYRVQYLSEGDLFYFMGYRPNVVKIQVSLTNRAHIEGVFQIFERNLGPSKIVVAPAPIKVFIGHGHDPQWRDLKDHLHDLHGFEVVAYEVGPRAGLSVKEILEKMLSTSSFALLVLTGEDIHSDGEPHARENVIHELGLFQARLGFPRAIALLEEGVKEFSNILGVNQIRFANGHIRETFGDVIATIRREFQSP